MDSFWKWLMHLNARRVCTVCMLAFLCVIGWRATIEFRPGSNTALPSSSGGKFVESEYKDLGAIAFVEEQLNPEYGIVPVSPFRPPADAMPTNQVVSGDMTVTLHHDRFKPPKQPKGGALITVKPPPRVDGFDWDDTKNDPKRPRRPSRPIRVYYRGVLERTDGATLAWISNSRRTSSRFIKAGDYLFGAKVISIEENRLKVQLSKDDTKVLMLDESVIITPIPKQK